MSKNSQYEVGQILKNSVGQYAKIISINDGRYGLSGWTTLRGATEAETTTLVLNVYGIEACEAEVTTDKASDDSDSSDVKHTKKSLKKLDEDALKALAIEQGVEVTDEDTKATVIEKLYTHFEL